MRADPSVFMAACAVVRRRLARVMQRRRRESSVQPPSPATPQTSSPCVPPADPSPPCAPPSSPSARQHACPGFHGDRSPAFYELCRVDPSAPFGTITARQVFHLHYMPVFSVAEFSRLPVWAEPPPHVRQPCVVEAARLQKEKGGLFHADDGCLRSVLCCDAPPGCDMCAGCALLAMEMVSTQQGGSYQQGSILQRVKRRRRAMEAGGQFGAKTHLACLTRADQASKLEGGKRARHQKTVERKRATVAVGLHQAKHLGETELLQAKHLGETELLQQQAAAEALAHCQNLASVQSALQAGLVAQGSQLLVGEARASQAQAGQARAVQVAALDFQLERRQQAEQCGALMASYQMVYETHLLSLQSGIEQRITAAKVEQLSQMPEIVQRLHNADLHGRLEQYPEAVELISGMAACLENGSTRGRKLNTTEQHFYGMLLNSGNPWVQEFVAKNLFGPSLRWTQQHRCGLPTIPIGEVSDANVVLLTNMLTQLGLRDVPGLVSEDGSTSSRHVDWGDLLGATEAEVWANGVTLYGFSGNPVVVHSLEELQALFDARKHVIANYVYVYTWVPVLPHAPHVPFCIVATDNCFNGKWVWDTWRPCTSFSPRMGSNALVTLVMATRGCASAISCS